MSTYDRKAILLRATYDMLKKLKDFHYVESPFENAVFYDDADCDGTCLMEDIRCELDLEEGTKPLKKPIVSRRRA